MRIDLTLSRTDTPIGVVAVATDAAGGVRGVSFDGADPSALTQAMRRLYPEATSNEGGPPARVAAALARYFEGESDGLKAIPWSFDGARTDADGFQAAVWRALADVPAGTTISYGEMARRAGQPGAAQAAGVALNRNPLPLILPCHRVVGADGAMVGFGGGLERKTWLLRHEGALLI
jgi:methylated-DNA-[protein]-cysteine S-methyltransferase